MKNVSILSLAALCLLLASHPATAQTWLWATSFGGNNISTSVSEMGNEICADASGNLYTAGTYSGSMTLGSFSYTSNQSNMWVGKQNSNGTWLWAFPSPTTSSSQSVTATSIALDNNGDVIVAGQYIAWQSNITGSGYALEPTSNASSTNGFVMKINGSTGAFVWCTRIWSSTASSAIEVNGVTTDATGNVYVAGSFMGTAGFSNGTALIANSGANGKDAFALKLNSSGNYQWFKRIYDLNYTVGANDNVVGQDIAVDASGNIYLAGLGKCSGFAHTASLYAASTSPSSNDAFIAKWDNTGAAVSAWAWGSSNSDGCYGMDISANGNLVVAGQYNNKPWVSAVNPTTGVAVYSITPTGTGTGALYDVDTDASNNAYATGFNSGGPLTYGASAITTSTNDNLIVKVSGLSNSFFSALSFASTSNNTTNTDTGRGIVALGVDEYAVTGGIIIGSGVTLGSTTLVANGFNDNFVARYGTCANAAISQHPANASICTGASAPTLSVTASGTGITYQWQSLSGSTWGNVATGGTAATYTPTAAGTYRVTVTGACGSPVTSNQAVLTVNALPSAGITGTTTICAGANTTLTATGGTSYSWSNGQTTAAISVSPSAATTYTVTVTDANNCSATASQAVTVNALPTAGITGTTTVCAGTATTLTASGGTSYSWSNGQTTAAISVSPTTTTTYTVTVTNANNCAATASQAVTVNALPTAGISGATTVCDGTSTTLIASGGTSYSWSNGQNTAAITVTPTTTTTYTVTVTNANNCTATASQAVTVNALPTAGISGITTLCAGSNTTLTATGGTSYVWNTGTVGATLFLIPSATTSYTVTVTDANNCQNTATATVTVNALPTAAISGTTTICEGDTTTLTATGGTSYSWNSGQTTAAIAVNPSNSTTYTVTVTNASNCSTTVSQLVGVVGLPNVTITGTTSICPGGGTTLTASTFGQNTFLWSNGQTNNHITVFPTVATSYSVTLTNQSGCKNSDTVTVTINPLPVATISGPSGVCAGSSATLVASGGATFAWNDGSTNANLTVSPTTPTTYTVTVMDLNGCTDTASATVGVVATTTITSPTQQIAVCVGQPISFTVAVSGSGTLTYAWNLDGTPLAATGPTISGTAIAGDAGTYAVSATSDCGTATDTVAVVTVNALPVAAISGNTAVCDGASTTLTATGGTSYSWSTGAAGATLSVTPSSTTSYTVTVTDANSCQNTATATVTVNPLPVPVIIQAGPALSTGTFTAYQWLLDGQPVNGATSQNFTATQNGTYTVTVVDGNGCFGLSAPVAVTNVAVDARQLAGVRISPNPTSGLLTITSDQALSGSLLTLTGEKVMAIESANALDLSTLADGVYLLHLRAQDGSEARVRVVKMQ